MLEAILTIGATSGLTLLLLALYMRRALPNLVQEAGNDFAAALGEQLTNPTVKKAFGIIGSQGGDSRRMKGAEKMLADGVLTNVSPEIKIILDKIAPNIIEQYGADTALALAAKYAPMIQRFLPNLGLGGKVGDKGQFEQQMLG